MSGSKSYTTLLNAHCFEPTNIQPTGCGLSKSSSSALMQCNIQPMGMLPLLQVSVVVKVELISEFGAASEW